MADVMSLLKDGAQEQAEATHTGEWLPRNTCRESIKRAAAWRSPSHTLPSPAVLQRVQGQQR